MGYRMMIGVNEEGQVLIGAAQVRAAREDGTLADWEEVYPSQLRHRVVTRCGRYALRILTPTEARKFGEPIVARFPAANGALRRR